MAYLTGKLPVAIVAVSSNSGGFCITYDPEKIGEIETKQDIDNDVMISMGGYLSEELIFNDSKKRLLGSGNDIDSAWDELSNAAYSLGYFNPFAYCNYGTVSGPIVPPGMSDEEIKTKISDRFVELKTKTTQILEENRSLIIEVAKRLGQDGEISGSVFLEYIKKNTGTLTEPRLEEAKKETTYDYYRDVLFKE